MRKTLGIAVFSGMLGVTIFGIFFTPVFYVVVRWFTERKTAPPVDMPTSDSPAEANNGPGAPATTEAAVTH